MKNLSYTFAKTSSALLLGFSALAANAQSPSYQAPEMFQITKDTRTCAAPACGGVFMSTLNAAVTVTCPDGSVSTRCYVGTLDMSLSEYDVPPFEFSKGESVKVWAAYNSGDANNPYGKLQIRTSLLPIGKTSPIAVRQIYAPYLPLNEFGEPIEGCTITDGSPCLKYVLYQVNKIIPGETKQLTVSSFDFSKLALTDTQIKQFVRFMKNGFEPVLMKIGDVKNTTSPTGDVDVRMTVEGLFLPVEYFITYPE